MKLFKKIFRNKETMSVDAIETWIVKWLKYIPQSSIAYMDWCHQAFPTKEAAEHFVSALEDAEKLVKTDFQIKLYKQEG